MKAYIDFPDAGSGREALAFDHPRAVLQARTVAEVRPLLRQAQALAGQGAWVVGYLAYEAAPAFDPAFRVAPDPGIPLAWFAAFDAPLAQAVLPDPRAQAPLAWSPDVTRERYQSDVARLREDIGAGVLFQANYTLRLHAPFDGNALALFARLRAAQPHSYAAYLAGEGWSLHSVSPELFFRRQGDLVTTQPMKGTAPRGRWCAEDDERARALQTSDKDRAENLMIVDVLRNDLSRIAVRGTVRVPALFEVERHPTVLQMTSTVTARLPAQAGVDDIFTALFPCASITGAPKVIATRRILELEGRSRGAYCGSIGLLRPGGDAVFNVAIRTVTVSGARATCGVGSGIVWDSRPGAEYEETLLKARFLRSEPADFDLIETLRLQGGVFVRLERHLARMADSARYLRRHFDPQDCRARLAAAATKAGAGDYRVRLLLPARGEPRIELHELPSPAPQGPRIALATHPMDRRDPMLYHKTSRRTVYEQAARDFPEAFDVLLFNAEGELTEFTRGNLVLDIDGRRRTPRLDCGLLPGCLRAELLESGAVEEAVLRREDLERADAIWFVNSLRGEVRVYVDGPARESNLV